MSAERGSGLRRQLLHGANSQDIREHMQLATGDCFGNKTLDPWVEHSQTEPPADRSLHIHWRTTRLADSGKRELNTSSNLLPDKLTTRFSYPRHAPEPFARGEHTHHLPLRG